MDLRKKKDQNKKTDIGIKLTQKGMKFHNSYKRDNLATQHAKLNGEFCSYHWMGLSSQELARYRVVFGVASRNARTEDDKILQKLLKEEYIKEV